MADKKNAQVLTGEQLSLSVLPLSGSIVASGGKIDTTCLVDTENGQQLAYKVFNIDGGGGSSLPSQEGHNGEFLTTDGTDASWAEIPTSAVPTIKWFQNKTGTTLATGLDLSNANLIKVYKNGVLLEETTQADRTYTLYTGGQGKFVALTRQFPITNDTTSWSFECTWLHNTSSSQTEACLIASTSELDGHSPFLINLLGTDQRLRMLCAESNSGSFGLQVPSVGEPFVPTNGKVYDVKAWYDVNAYYLAVREHLVDSDFTLIGAQENTNFKAGNSTGVYPRLLNGLNGATQYTNNSSIYMESVKMVVDGVTVFDGATAVLGTDFTNTNCTVSTYQEAADAADYSVNAANGIITLTTPLVATDKITVEVF